MRRLLDARLPRGQVEDVLHLFQPVRSRLVGGLGFEIPTWPKTALSRIFIQRRLSGQRYAPKRGNVKRCISVLLARRTDPVVEAGKDQAKRKRKSGSLSGLRSSLSRPVRLERPPTSVAADKTRIVDGANERTDARESYWST